MRQALERDRLLERVYQYSRFTAKYESSFRLPFGDASHFGYAVGYYPGYYPSRQSFIFNIQIHFNMQSALWPYGPNWLLYSNECVLMVRSVLYDTYIQERLSG